MTSFSEGLLSGITTEGKSVSGIARTNVTRSDQASPEEGLRIRALVLAGKALERRDVVERGHSHFCGT